MLEPVYMVVVVARKAGEFLDVHKFMAESVHIMTKAASETNASEFFQHKSTMDQYATFSLASLPALVVVAWS